MFCIVKRINAKLRSSSKLNCQFEYYEWVSLVAFSSNLFYLRPKSFGKFIELSLRLQNSVYDIFEYPPS